MDRIGRLVRTARKHIHHHGLRNAAYAALLKALGHHVLFKVLRVHYAEEVNPSLLQFPRPYAGSFLAPRELEALVQNPEAALSEEFLRYALAKGDKCYGFVHDGALKAFGWYATTPTRVSPDLRVHFKRDYIYVHKGFTHERHRGQRLFPLGMTRALKHYRAAGYKGMLLYVDANNLDSLKSCAGMGFRVSGSVYIVRLRGRYFIYSSPGCERFGFRVEDVSDAAETKKWGRISGPSPSTKVAASHKGL